MANSAIGGAAHKAVGMPETRKVHGLPPSYEAPGRPAVERRGGAALLGGRCLGLLHSALRDRAALNLWGTNLGDGAIDALQKDLPRTKIERPKPEPKEKP
jgi:hypothetical protein